MPTLDITERNGHAVSKRSIGQLHADTQMLIDYLRPTKRGITVEYSELDHLLGRDVRDLARCNMYTAMAHLAREQVYFVVVRGEGLRCVDAEAFAIDARQHLTRSRKSARRYLSRAACVDPVHLSTEEQYKHNAACSVAAALIHMSRPAALAKMEKHLANADNNARLAVGRTLEFLRSH